MKLVDILARGLKEWPDCARYILFDHANSCYADLGQGYSPLGIDCSDFDDDTTDKSCTTVYRAQWQASVDALKAENVPSAKTQIALEEARGIRDEKAIEWKRGELPPVGTICEHAPGGSSDNWYQVEIIEHRRFNDAPYLCAVFVTHNDVSFSSHESFRPIRTPEQIAAEDRERDIDAMVKSCPYPGSDFSRIDCAALYDAGYRKFEIVDN